MNRTNFAEKPSKPELLAPGGSYEKCRIAFIYGADAVYVGAQNYSLRAAARNLNSEELAAVSFLARTLGKKVYVAVNIYARDADLTELPAFFQYLLDIRVDGIIVSDPGILMLARQHAAEVPLHLSTQANTTNSYSVNFWQGQGIRRINLARELSFSELCEIRRRCRQIELELFVHGAMCVSYSGRCLLSALLNQRSANQGLCTQPCRWSYRLVEEKRPGQYFPITEDSRGTYIFNSKDLCLISELDRLLDLGIDSLKIEGRMKGALYLANVVRSYRLAIDQCRVRPADRHGAASYREDLLRVSHRPYTKGFLFAHEDLPEISPTTAYVQTHTLAGIVRAVADGMELIDNGTAPGSHCVTLEVRSRLNIGDRLEFLYPDGRTLKYTLTACTNLVGAPLETAHPNTWIRFSVPFRPFPLQVVSTARVSGR